MIKSFSSNLEENRQKKYFFEFNSILAKLKEFEFNCLKK